MAGCFLCVSNSTAFRGAGMNMIDYIVIGGLSIAAVCAVIFIIHSRKQGKNGCGYCPHRESCDKVKNK